MLAAAIALGHERALLFGVPLYVIGTWLRISEEERLLRAMFGATYDSYAARVRRFLPGVF
jgi:protein-S-isoprenylcysteine O-methyltransferase Ste14